MLHQQHPVPHLLTRVGPLQEIEKLLLNNQAKIEAWFRDEWRKTRPPFYCSVDLRNAGFKLAPVDTNLFPAGFNNLDKTVLPLAVHAAQAFLSTHFSGCLRILLIPENHSRNMFYYENIASLQQILVNAGYEVLIGSLREDLLAEETITLPSSREIKITPLHRKDNRLYVGESSPCLILLNNDLSAGIPDILQNIEQQIFPLPQLGWFARKKSTHFGFYQKITERFAALLGIDSWLIDPYFDVLDDVDFMARQGEEALSEKVDHLLKRIQAKYDFYKITEKPYVVIKADAGTYGMGVMTVQSADEVLQLNRKERTRMAASKGNQPIHRVLLQEGVHSFEHVGDPPAVAEPVVYMMGQYVIGGFYRVHQGRGINENLNAPGMHFEPLAFAETCCTPNTRLEPDAAPNRFYAYGVIARLALLAAAHEEHDLSAS